MLTEYRRKDNNVKLLDLINIEFKELDGLFKTIEAWRDVDEAEGIVLDEIGREVGQLRKGTSDEVFRFLIKGKILSNNSKGDIFTVTNVISTILNIPSGEFSISESYIKDKTKAGNVVIESIPFRTMLESGLTVDELVMLVKSTLAAGVGIEKLELTGSFQYVDELENDMDLGFSDVSMEKGGTLSMVYQDKE